METTMTHEYPKGVTIDDVWAVLRDLAQSQKETDRIQKETDKKIKEIGNRLGDFTNSFGNVIEHLVSPNLQEKFNKLGYDFQEVSTMHKILDKKNDIRFEIDVFLQNGDTAMYGGN